MDYRDLVTTIMFSRELEELNVTKSKVKGFFSEGDFLNNLILNISFIANELHYINKDLLKAIAYERILGKEKIKSIIDKEELTIEEEFFEKCQDLSLAENNLVTYMYNALKNSKRIDYSNTKFKESDLIVKIENEIIKNSKSGKIKTGELYEILAKESNGDKK